MAVTISCPHCNVRIQLLPEQSGQTMTCPACKGAFHVPAVAAPARPAAPVTAKPIALTPAARKTPQAAPEQPQTPTANTGHSLSALAGQFREMLESATKTSAKRRAKFKPAPNKNLLITFGALARWRVAFGDHCCRDEFETDRHDQRVGIGRTSRKAGGDQGDQDEFCRKSHERRILPRTRRVG